MDLRWAITGCRGQLGHAFGRLLAPAEIAAAGDLPELDVADPRSLERFLEGLAPPLVVVNTAAFTQVDGCEKPENRAAVWGANAEGPGLLAELCARRGFRLVHVSTDYVFPGDASRPYREGDPPGPRSEYGRSKLEGERRVLAGCPSALVVRTSWVFGRGRNFMAAILAQARKRRLEGDRTPLRVVDDQHGRPTYAPDLAAGIRALVEAGARGLYHVANRGEATWWEVARACLDEAGFADLEVDRIRTRDLNLAAPRPLYSVLDCSKAEAAGVHPREWREALRAYLASPDSPLASGGSST